MKKFKAVLFDFDGTLVNTEEICAKVHPILFKKYGYFLNKKQTLELRSAGYPLRQNLIKKWFNPKEPDVLVHQIEKDLHSYIRLHKNQCPMKLKPGCIEILEYLKQNNIPAIIATSSLLAHVEEKLQKLEKENIFQKSIQQKA